MAETQSNACLRADAGLPASGVIHVRTRLTAGFTVIANTLAQRRGSAVTVGVATYILSLPDGAPVSIAALCEHFSEGDILISRALRELEAAGYLERRRERRPNGVIRTRTFFHDVPTRGDHLTPATPPRPRKRAEKAPGPGAAAPGAAADPGTDEVCDAEGCPPQVSPLPPVPPSRPTREPAAIPVPEPSRAPTTAAGPEAGDAPASTAPSSRAEADPQADPQAAVILASLRLRDRRLILSDREVAKLAPQVSDWLARGTGPEEITELLVTGLPERLLTRPARILAYRLGDLPAAIPAQPARPTNARVRRAVLPWQTCDGGCERAFRAVEPGVCRDCRADADTPTAGQIITHNELLRKAC